MSGMLQVNARYASAGKRVWRWRVSIVPWQGEVTRFTPQTWVPGKCF